MMRTTQTPSRTYHIENLWCFSIYPPSDPAGLAGQKPVFHPANFLR
jgi:hypothetical protein